MGHPHEYGNPETIINHYEPHINHILTIQGGAPPITSWFIIPITTDITP